MPETEGFKKPLKPEYSEQIRKAKKGDEKAFGELYEVYFESIYRFIFYRVSHKEIAEDLAEDVFIKAWTKIASVKDASFGGWLYQIAKNKIIDHYRQSKSTSELTQFENILEAENNLIEETNLLLNQKMFLEALKKLTPEQQIVIQLKFIEEMDNAEISELISKSEGSIRVIQHRAIQKLQELLEHKTNNDFLDNSFNSIDAKN